MPGENSTSREFEVEQGVRSLPLRASSTSLYNLFLASLHACSTMLSESTKYDQGPLHASLLATMYASFSMRLCTRVVHATTGPRDGNVEISKTVLVRLFRVV